MSQKKKLHTEVKLKCGGTRMIPVGNTAQAPIADLPQLKQLSRPPIVDLPQLWKQLAQ
jgi:hypothetical protein